MTSYMRLIVGLLGFSFYATGADYVCRAGELLPQAGEWLQAEGQDYQGEIADPSDSLA